MSVNITCINDIVISNLQILLIIFMNNNKNLLFCWDEEEVVIKCACNRSAVEFPSVISKWLKSLLKKAFAPPESVTAKICIGRLGMFIEKALKTTKYHLTDQQRQFQRTLEWPMMLFFWWSTPK